jgi:hypothetical protein
MKPTSLMYARLRVRLTHAFTLQCHLLVSDRSLGVSDEQALELISYEGKLPTTDRRPRFCLSAEQVRILSTMLEIDSALAAAGINRAWLRRRGGKLQQSPLDLMRAGATDEVLRSLTQATLRPSVAKTRKTRAE